MNSFATRSLPGSSSRKMLVSIAAVALIALVFVMDVRRRDAEEQLKNLTVRLEQLQGSNTQENEEAAREVVANVRLLMDIPEDVEPTVATIVDVMALREQNPFYEKAENGDHLIVTPERAILYSSSRNIILDVVPVQIEAAQGEAAAAPPAVPEGAMEPIGEAPAEEPAQ